MTKAGENFHSLRLTINERGIQKLKVAELYIYIYIYIYITLQGL